MKHLYLLIVLLLLGSTYAKTTNDTIFFWKAGATIAKRSVKTFDLDSITFKRPVVNIPQVTICTQVWTTKNLDVTAYSDGTPIPQVTDPMEWANLTTGAWCYYNNDPANNAVYGKLYNWYAAAGIYNAASLANPTLRKNLAPAGWHVPTDAEWTTLTACLGGKSVAGGKMKETGTAHWTTPNTDATNSSGFTGLPGGYRYPIGMFSPIGGYGYWWSSSETSAKNGWYYWLYYDFGDAVISKSGDKIDGFSVRCLKD
jgi:uncharacterized protein (TIGR02145 family)